MNRERINTGIILIGIGIMFLLANFGLISWWSFGALFEFWPLILVVVGINIMFKKNTIVSVISWVLFFGVIIGFSLYGYNSDVANAKSGTRNIDVIKQEETTNAELKMTLGGAKMDISSTDELLLDADYSNKEYTTEADHRNGNKKVSITVEPIRHNNFIKTKSDSGFFNAKLHKDVIWDIDADIGAVSGDMNLSDLYIEDLKLDIGAGNIDLYLGDQSPLTNVDIDAGASKLMVYVKEESGVKIRINGVLNKTNLSDLGWNKEDDYYYSPNYDDAESKINIDISAGVGTIDLVVGKGQW